MSFNPRERDTPPTIPKANPQIKFGLIDLMLTVVGVAIGLAPVRALGQTWNGVVITAVFCGINLPFLALGWFRLWKRPVSRFQSARHWLLVGFTSAILVALMAFVAPILRLVSSG